MWKNDVQIAEKQCKLEMPNHRGCESNWQGVYWTATNTSELQRHLHLYFPLFILLTPACVGSNRKNDVIHSLSFFQDLIVMKPATNHELLLTTQHNLAKQDCPATNNSMVTVKKPQKV